MMNQDLATKKMIVKRVDDMTKYILFSYIKSVSGDSSYLLDNKGFINSMPKLTQKKLMLIFCNRIYL